MGFRYCLLIGTAILCRLKSILELISALKLDAIV